MWVYRFRGCPLLGLGFWVGFNRGTTRTRVQLPIPAHSHVAKPPDLGLNGPKRSPTLEF